MDGISVVPKQERAPAIENAWTLTKACMAGETYPLAGHNVKVVRILEERGNSNLCLVEVGDPIGNSPALAFTGDFSDRPARFKV